MTRIYKKFGKKIKQDEKRGLSIIVGLTKMKCCESGKFGKDSSKVWQKI